MLFIFLIDFPTQISHKSEIMMDERKKIEKKNEKEKRAKQKIETNKKKKKTQNLMTKEVVKE